MSAAATEKQTTIYTTYCAQKTKARRANNERDFRDFTSSWDDDFVKVGFSEYGIDLDKSRQKNVRPVRVFNAWVEEWERPMLQQKDFIN